MFVLIASSCSQDDEAMDAAVLAKEINSELLAKGGKVIVANAPTPIIGLFTYSSTSVCLGDDLTVTFDNLWGEGSDCGETKIFYTLNGTDWIQLAKGTPTDGKLSVTFEPVAGTYSFRADFNGNEGGCDEGFANLKSQDNTSHSVVEVAPCDDCPYNGNGFTGNAVSCGTSRVAEYTFSSEDGVGNFKMQGGLTNFTGTNATVYVNGELVVFSGTSSDDWAQGITTNGYTVGQRTPSNDNGNGNGSSNRNIRVVGELSECSAVVVRIEWTSSNTGTTMTGGWSVKDGELELAPPVADLVCPI